MAESNNVPSDQMGEEERLRYLAFVQAAAVQAVVCAAGLYAYAKESAGPLKPGVETVEGTVKTVVGPVYERFHAVPLGLLKFVDRKVSESVQDIDRHVPSLVKDAPNLARSVAGEVHRTGLVGAASGLARSAISRYEPVAKGIYSKYEPVAERAAVSTWRSLNHLPLFPHVAQAVVPTAAHLSERYNRAVCFSAEKGYAVASYLPLVPMERIAEVFAEQTDEQVVPPAPISAQ